MGSVADWFNNLFGRKSGAVSCNQNTGPFNNVDTPNLSKDDFKVQLKNFYKKCLQPNYKDGYLTSEADGSSESQSYALWQAYWSNDQKTFARVYDWTNQNLKHRDDALFAWKFQIKKHSPLKFWQKPYFSNHTVEVLDSNSATDADTDIAYVLLRAGTDWKNQEYIDQGKKIASDIWDQETVELQGHRFVSAGNWANEPTRIVINPSYYSPQAYRMFTVYDGSHDWNSLLSDSYSLLATISDHGAGQPIVPPNWIQINKLDGSIAQYDQKSDANDFSYDAFRTMWRVSLDQLATPSFASWDYISSIKNFETDWAQNQQLCALYLYKDSRYTCDTSTTSTLAAPLSVFSVTNGYAASQLVQKYYIKDGTLSFPDTAFYGKSWHWFGAFLWAHS